ncbi:glycoside hydrolase family 3 protein [Ruminococcus albus]|uniref:beta-N-acetylhexosaminidase n=1 Tax=Ruminococcus albus (strain ATCC 27210 / DSM 20455 / JCM 14654 / NCDO 2250 / 7) TaxID=697329 RepID=E6UKD2_RUMA7|nr:glycoside hydrolase family 3 N-terminal domain-containing protein [Ruminococcus albus]ADU24128.1 glycoside hydrolase family 3 domain protein [Ruminococcus albus 7 = DSM 20455]
MSKPKKKASAKTTLIRNLIILLVITGALSAFVINGYFKNRPAETAESKTSDNTSKQSSDNKTDKTDDDTTDAEEPDKTEDKPSDDKDIASSAADTSSSMADENAGKEDEITKMMSEMSLHEKICQLFVVTPEGLTGYDLVTESGAATLDALKEYPVGGLIYFAQNLENTEQTKTMISATAESNSVVSDIPLFFAVDEEGGIVARCADKLGTTAFKPMYNYREKGTDTAYSNAFTIASDIAGLGFNLDFAPVADTWSNPDNTVIGTRAYSDDFQQAAELVAGAVKGFKDGGVVCSLKHFPGHGDTAEDSHVGMASSYKTVDELENAEYLAFESGIAAGADMVMVGHITMVNIDNQPASLSKTIITDELRGKLGFDGVVVTDALAMGALANYYSSDEIAVAVLKAGGDLLLMPEDLDSAVKGIEKAVKNGDLTEKRIDESLERVLRLKKERGILS